MTIESFESKTEDNNKDKQPIVDIELNKATLDEWERRGLDKEIEKMLSDYKFTSPPGEKLGFLAENFPTATEFVRKAEISFAHFHAKNERAKLKEVESLTEKAILNFAFEKLGFDVRNPIKIKEEKIEANDKEITLRYFATNQPDTLLVFDGEYWYLKEEKTDSRFLNINN